MGNYLGLFIILILGFIPLAFGDEKSPFDIDLTPDENAVQSSQTVRQPQNPSSLTGGPVASPIQNPNPDISFVADFLGGNQEALTQPVGGTIHNPAYMREMEVDGVGYVSPYAKAVFVASFDESGASAEEVNMDFFNVLPSFDLRVGKLLIDTDTLNPLHQHAVPFYDKPLVMQHAFGDESLKTVGANLSWIVPNPWDHYVLLSLTYGSNLNTSDQYTALYSSAATLASPVYSARVGSSWDIGDVSYLNVNATEVVSTFLGGLSSVIYMGDMLFRYAPNPAANAITFLNGYLWNQNNPNQTGSQINTGFYSYLGWQFSPRWRIGTRYDQTINTTFGGFEQMYSGILSFYPTETNYIRLQYGRHELTTNQWENRIALQIDFTIGPHQPHTAL